MEDKVWRSCSSCKKPIYLGASYYVCSVSTCNGQRIGYVFCSIPCFERHLPVARHKDAGAIEKKAPLAIPSENANPQPANRVYATNVSKTSSSSTTATREVLVIASRLKDYVQARSEYNTSGAVMDVLSDHLRVLCDRAIDNARAEGRKTVMDRDFDFLKKI